MADKRVVAFKLRAKTEAELTKDLENYKKELHNLKIAKIAGGTPARLAKIKVVKKSIAKFLTVINEKALDKVRT